MSHDIEVFRETVIEIDSTPDDITMFSNFLACFALTGYTLASIYRRIRWPRVLFRTKE